MAQRNHAILFSLSAFSVVLGALPAKAHACGGSPCAPADFFPNIGSVPANLPAVLWWPGSLLGAPATVTHDDVRFVRIVDGVNTDVEFELVARDDHYEILPSAPLEVGARYAVWSLQCKDESDAGVWSESFPEQPPLDRQQQQIAAEQVGGSGYLPAALGYFEVTDAAPMPDSLGQLQATSAVRREIEVPDQENVGECSNRIEAVTVDIHLAERSAWYGALEFGTVVDGKPYRPRVSKVGGFRPGGSWIGRGVDRLFVSCALDREEPSALTAGNHRVQLVASIPGTAVQLVSDEVVVNLSCDAAVPNAEDDAPIEPASDTPLSARGDADAGTVRSPSKTSAGCSVSAPVAAGWRASAWAGLVFALGLIRHRRARSRA
ncbi:MAG: hypothetical protein QM778_12190 [Myxococcales bacterium]